jgi:hypothetical protein
MQLAKRTRASLARPLSYAKNLWPPRAKPAAIVLSLGALAFLLAWWLGDLDSLDAWTPNIVVGAVVLAATITFVEGIVQREADERSKPRRERALDVIGKAFWEFAFHAYTDILFTTVKTAPTDLNIPSDSVALFEFWVKWQDKKDAPRPRLGMVDPCSFPKALSSCHAFSAWSTRTATSCLPSWWSRSTT